MAHFGNQASSNNGYLLNKLHYTTGGMFTANTNYVLTAWRRSSANVVGGSFGVCTVPGTIISELNSGSHTTVSVFAGDWPPAPTRSSRWMTSR